MKIRKFLQSLNVCLNKALSFFNKKNINRSRIFDSNLETKAQEGMGARLIKHILDAEKATAALHDIKIKLSSNLHSYLVEQGYVPYKNNKMIQLEMKNTYYTTVKFIVYPETILIDIGCSEEPVTYLPAGATRLASLLAEAHYFLCAQSSHKVKDYMSRKVATCRQSDSLKFVLNMLNRNCMSRLVVTDNDGNPEGVITTNTFLRHFSNFKKASSKEADDWNYLKFKIAMPVKAILHEDLLTVNQDEDLAKAALLMIDKIISGIPVVNKKKDLVGLISKSDIVRAFDDVETHHILLEKYKLTH